MKHPGKILIASLLLALAAASGYCQKMMDDPRRGEGMEAKDEKGIVHIIPPDYGAAVLPVFSSTTFSMVRNIDLTVEMLDDSGKMVSRDIVQWRNGYWQNVKRQVVSMVQFPLKGLKFQDGRMPGSYKLTYKFTAQKDKKVQIFTLEDSLPLNNGKFFWVPADFPLELGRVDAGGLEWADDAKGDGLRSFRFTLKRSLGGRVMPEAFALSGKEPRAEFLVEKKGAVTAEGAFMCMSGSKLTQIKWDGSGKDLRAKPYELNIVPDRPACPK